MKIAVSGGKGGTGKSLVAAYLSIALARKSKIMLVDADVECPNDHIILSAEREEKGKIDQKIPKWDFSKCRKCGKCAEICKQNAIVFVKDRYPAFVSDMCIGCGACIAACPYGAIGTSKKEIGKVYTGKNHGVFLVSGELKLGELASGEVVAELRKMSDKIDKDYKSDFMIIDSAAGIGCPVIASIVGTDYVILVTEPTPSALHDLKRCLYLSSHFGIRSGIVINKHDIDTEFCKEIEKYAAEIGIPVLGKIPYSRDFITSSGSKEPVLFSNPEYMEIFDSIAKKIL